MPIWKIQVWKSTKSNYSKSMMHRVMVLVHCTSAQWVNLSIKFQVCSWNTFWVMLRTKFNNEKEQWEITPNVWNFELWFLCPALFTNEIYLPMKFHVDALHNFKVILRTKKDGQTDGRRTDGRRTDGRMNESIIICHPSGGGIKSYIFY